MHRVGFKVIYPILSGNVSINHGGPFDDSDKLEALRASVELVREHPALLGYYVCDDCCSNNHDVSLQAQVYAVMKDVDPYHPTIGASARSRVPFLPARASGDGTTPRLA